MKLIPSLLFITLILSTQSIFVNLLDLGMNIIAKSIQASTQSLSTFNTKYKKTYSSVSELAYRTVILKTNLDIIQAHNKNPKNKYTLGITRFADMTTEEFQAKILIGVLYKSQNFTSNNSQSSGSLSNNKNKNSLSTQLFQNSNIFGNSFGFYSTLSPISSLLTSSSKSSIIKPTTVNWKQKNIAGVVKNQGECGSCFAFSALGAIQGMYLINKMNSMGVAGKLLGKNENITLSEQYIIDCCNVPGRCDLGCKGGYVWDVFDFVSKYGVSLQSTYPYSSLNNVNPKKCNGIKGDFKNILNTNSPYTNVTRKDVDALKEAVLKGPVSVLIDATNLPFYVVNDTSKTTPFSNCGNDVNHAVLLVGVDAEGNWLVKNSWGPEWGDQGYITLAAGNTCGIANYAVYPNPYL